MRNASGAKALIAEGQTGTVSFRILDDKGRVSFDASNELPAGYRLITQRYLDLLPPADPLRLKLNLLEWLHDPMNKVILLGDVETPEDVLSLLHEFGHAHHDSAVKHQALEQAEHDAAQAFLARNAEATIAQVEEQARIRASLEVQAWKWAIGRVQHLRSRSGIDMLEFFPDPGQADRYAADCLVSYAKYYHWVAQQYGVACALDTNLFILSTRFDDNDG